MSNKQEELEQRVQEIKKLLLVDEGRVHGEERQALLDEQHELEKQLAE